MKKFLLSLFAIAFACVIGSSVTLADGGDYRHAKAATATSGAATLNNLSGTITSEALTTAAAASYTLTLTNSKVRTDSIAAVNIANGTNTQGIPVLSTVTYASGTMTVKIVNLHATQALNGTLLVRFNLQP